MTVDKNGVFKCLCPPKFGGPLCEGKPLLLFFFNTNCGRQCEVIFLY